MPVNLVRDGAIEYNKNQKETHQEEPSVSVCGSEEMQKMMGSRYGRSLLE